ncbi:DinB family protein [Caldibacillus lycopersici]|uniref:DinB family protein n=1 Tax=Perspicuibacillus lycopersici TaxID=1325689 RepID=A0AAE3ITP0_9BACI|nr:DinB family protein [Perspicuibacillus lycopersici]MCU9614438.1 DinB family protein [Perspicuibacillus lycopersici]
MQSKEQLINDFSTLISFVQSLAALDEKRWLTPIQEGKWTTRDIIAHIMLWDKYFLEEAIIKIVDQHPVTVKHLDFDQFNKNAVIYAKGKSKQEICDMAIYYRAKIVSHLKYLSDEEFFKEHIVGDGNKFSAYSYIEDFIDHDTHHINQVKKFLATS